LAINGTVTCILLHNSDVVLSMLGECTIICTVSRK
jgi:hypothetical protein